MPKRTVKVQELLNKAIIAYDNKDYLESYEYANKAFEINPYDGLVYAYRAFAHIWYSYWEHEELYEQNLLDDLSISIGVSFDEDGESEEYYQVALFCCRQYYLYTLCMLTLLIDEIEKNKREFSAQYRIEDLEDEAYGILAEQYAQFENAIESLWDLAIFSKIKKWNEIPLELIDDAVACIDEYRTISGKAAFEEKYQLFKKCIEISRFGASNADIANIHTSDSDIEISKKRIKDMKHQQDSIRQQANTKLLEVEKEIEAYYRQINTLGFLQFKRKNELQELINTKIRAKQSIINRLDSDISALEKQIQKHEERLSKFEA